MTRDELLARDDEIVRLINSDEVKDESEYNRLLIEKAAIEVALLYEVQRP